MQSQENTSVERIIAKMDNDFNLDNTDYIPRIAAWVIDALNILKCTQYEPKRIKLYVKNRIAYSDCCLVLNDIKVFDKNGCRIRSNSECIACNPSTGEEKESDTTRLSDTMSHGETGADIPYYEELAMPKYATVNPTEYEIAHRYIPGYNKEKNYTIIDNKKIELNFDTPYIFVEHMSVKTMKSDIYNCELPVIPNNGLLIEAIAYYCMYKILCRGYKHPVFNLSASQYGTNPYYMWTTLQEKAKRSVINGNFEFDDNHAWSDAMYDFMFR